jgi:hypothetical protein
MNRIKTVISDIQSMVEYHYSEDNLNNYWDIIPNQFDYYKHNIETVLEDILSENNLIKTSYYNYTDVSCDILLYDLIILSFKSGHWLFDSELFRIDRPEIEIEIIDDDLTDKQRQVIADLTDTTASGDCFYYYTGDSIVMQLKTAEFIQHLLESGYVKESI